MLKLSSRLLLEVSFSFFFTKYLRLEFKTLKHKLFLLLFRVHRLLEFYCLFVKTFFFMFFMSKYFVAALNFKGSSIHFAL